VVVTKGMNNVPVAGLDQNDFSVSEDGERQRILSFVAHTGAPADRGTIYSPKTVLPDNTFADLPSPDDNLTPNVLLYDMLDTPIENQPRALKEIANYFRKKPPSARFAIFVLTDRLHLVQGLTSDDAVLTSALTSRANSTILEPFTPHKSGDASASALTTDRMRNDGMPSAKGLEHLESANVNYSLIQRTETILNAFHEIARFLSGVPGRKNIIWLLGSYPAGILPESTSLDDFADATYYSSHLQEMTAQLVLGEIAVYPIDVRGLMELPASQASNAMAYRTDQSFGRANRESLQSLYAQHTSMDVVAKDSGGRAFYNMNGLQDAIGSAVDQGTHYYTLSYSPTDKNFDGRLRKIHVSLKKRGCHLAYRQSYIAGEANPRGKKEAEEHPDRLEAVMLRGAPSVHEILFKVQITPVGSPSQPSEKLRTEMENLGALPDQEAGNSLESQHYLLRIAIVRNQLRLPQVNGSAFALKVELASQAYDDANRTLTRDRWLVDEQISAERAAEIQRDACRFSQEIEVPDKAARLKLAVRDQASGKIGSLEIPLPLSANGKGTGR
jgi:VWFA-related protein